MKVEGLNLDQVDENFVRQIAGDALQTDRDESLKESVEHDARRQELQKQITILQAKIRKEKQLNKQVQMNAELKRIKKEMGSVLNG